MGRRGLYCPSPQTLSLMSARTAPCLVCATAPAKPHPHRFAAENATEQRCRYFSKARKFVCRVKVPPGADDTKPLVVSTCVSNGAGGLAGEDRIITLSSVCEYHSHLARGWGRLSSMVPGPEPPVPQQ